MGAMECLSVAVNRRGGGVRVVVWELPVVAIKCLHDGYYML